MSEGGIDKCDPPSSAQVSVGALSSFNNSRARYRELKYAPTGKHANVSMAGTFPFSHRLGFPNISRITLRRIVVFPTPDGPMTKTMCPGL